MYWKTRSTERERVFEDATKIAVGILHELTSPLRCFRHDKMPIKRIEKRNEWKKKSKRNDKK